MSQTPSKQLPRGVAADPWLADVIGRPAFRLTFDELSARDASLRAELAAFLADGPKFAYSKVGCARVEVSSALEELGFRLVDTNVTLRKPFGGIRSATGAELRMAEPGDRDATVALAARSFELTRFHLDPRFSRPLADAVKGEWVRSYFLGKRGQAMVVALVAGQIAGFLLLIEVEPGRTVAIDLVAVDARQRGQGIGEAMVERAERHYAGRADTLQVGTQIANAGALRFYERIGFRAHDAAYVFHFGATGGGAICQATNPTGT